MTIDTNRSHARPTTAVGDAEGLVEVKVAYISSDFLRLAQSHLGIQVGAIHVDLAAGVVNQLADRLNIFLKHAISRRVGNHDCLVLKCFEIYTCNSVCILGNLVLQVNKVKIPSGIALDNNNFKTAHCRRGRIGAMGGYWNETNVTLTLAN